MNRIVLAEVTKLRTVRTTAGLVAAAAGIAGLLSLGAAAVAGDGPNPSMADPAFLRNLLGGAGMATVTALVAGVLVATGEHHHGTATATFLAVPRRARVVVAKAVVAVAFGVALAAVAVATTLGVGGLVAARDGVALFDGVGVEEARAAATILLRGAFGGAVGVAVGALVRNQVGALALALAWSQLVEVVVVPMVAPAAEPWLPDSLLAAVAGAARPDLLAPWPAIALLVAYAAAFVAVAGRTSDRVDLT